jgi:hypothetical protein
MYKSVIFYFSGTGNTWWVADRIKKQLDAKNINADAVSIDKLDAKKANWWIKDRRPCVFRVACVFLRRARAYEAFYKQPVAYKKGQAYTYVLHAGVFSGDGAGAATSCLSKRGL